MSVSYEELVEEFGFDLWPTEDRPKGRVGSPKPAWYLDGHIEEERRAVENQRAQLERGGVPRDKMYSILNSLEMAERRIRDIEEKFPKPEGAKKDKLARIRAELGDRVSESLFSYSDMTRGEASAREEVRRSHDPVVPVSREIARWILFCNGRVAAEGNSFKVNRNDAIRAWQIASKILHQSTNVERLRPMEHVDGPRWFEPPRGESERIEVSVDTSPLQEPPSELVGVNEIEDDPVSGDVEPVETLTDQEEDRPPCTVCGGSMEGEHHFAKKHKACRS